MCWRGLSGVVSPALGDALGSQRGVKRAMVPLGGMIHSPRLRHGKTKGRSADGDAGASLLSLAMRGVIFSGGLCRQCVLSGVRSGLAFSRLSTP
jgi:hypothetical protein